MKVNKDTMPEVLDIYRDIVTGALDRALALHQDQFCFEFELLPEMTSTPEWGVEIHKVMRDIMFTYEANKGIKSAMRYTPNDLREFVRPMILRSGENWENILKSIEGACKDGADYVSIESTAGKEICDQALVNADIKTVLFALGCMAARDMEYLWKEINRVCKANGAFGAGDSGCGFGNTAMVLAEGGYVPRVFGALVRIACAPRALIPYEQGSVGPNKDCSFEGVFSKMVCGYPIATEGKAASCAHFDQVGNIMMYPSDLWSNESIQQVKLLAGNSTVMSTEQLIYDCRMLNKAAEKGQWKWMRDILIESDCYLDPHAYIMKPDFAEQVALEIAKAPSTYLATLNAVKKGLELLKKGNESGELVLNKLEKRWLGRIESQLEEIPEDENKFIEEMRPEINPKESNLAEYAL
jgi:methanol--5-hydroxybenzimidazolylcobamide Co-methyltransferase